MICDMPEEPPTNRTNNHERVRPATNVRRKRCLSSATAPMARLCGRAMDSACGMDGIDGMDGMIATNPREFSGENFTPVTG